MALTILANVKDEMTCPICLELMKEPMSIDCGHSFCQACITSSYKSKIDLKLESNCPVCQMPYKFESLRLNRHMANIVQSLRGIELSSQKQNVHHCAQHGEKLQLFCKNDGKMICLLCERSQEHRGHNTCLLKEAPQVCQNKLQEAQKKLIKNKEEAEKWKVDLQQEKTSWKAQIQGKINDVQADFTKLRDILDSEEEKALQKLKKEEEDGLQTLAVSENELTQQSESVTQLISDVQLQHKTEPTMEKLQDVINIIRRCERFKLKKPIYFPKKKQAVLPITGLRGMLQVFQELTEARQYWVHVTMTANKNSRIDISQDKRQIKYQSTAAVCSKAPTFTFSTTNSSKNTSPFVFSGHTTFSQFPGNNLACLGVLGAPVITSGKHYWEVDVSKKTSWNLGLSDGRHFRPTASPDHSIYEVPRPKLGYWIIGMENKSKYKVFGEDSTTNFPLSLPLCLPVALDRVGVFVDYQAGSVSFYSTTFNAFLIYKFTNCCFPREVYPYFNPVQCSEPMTLC